MWPDAAYTGRIQTTIITVIKGLRTILHGKIGRNLQILNIEQVIGYWHWLSISAHILVYCILYKYKYQLQLNWLFLALLENTLTVRRNSWKAIGVKLKYRKKKIPRSWTQKTREKMCRKFGKSWSAKKRKDVYIFSRTCNNWWPNGQCFVWNLCLTAKTLYGMVCVLSPLTV